MVSRFIRLGTISVFKGLGKNGTFHLKSGRYKAVLF